MSDTKQMAIRLRKFNRLCPITGYKEGSIKVGAAVIVQTDRGVEYGEIVAYPHGLPQALARDVKLKKVLRYATQSDLEKVKSLPELEEKALRIASQKVQEHELGIKIVNVEYLFDINLATIYYKEPDNKKTKNLRDLTRDMSTALAARVNFRQLSPRDEAKMLGGLGHCGRNLCCSSWLSKPQHVTVRMAKEQGLQISPTKTSGICGRLMCCLGYEYEEKKKEGSQ